MQHASYTHLPTQDWVTDRRNYIGGSEVAAVLGLSPYATPLQVWMRKRGLIEQIPSNPVMDFGRIFEPIMAEYFTETTGLMVRNVQRTFKHAEHSFLRANIDRQILRSESHPTTGVLELKTTTSHRMKSEEGLIPMDWYCQIQHYLGITGYQYAYLVVYERDTCIFHEPVLIDRDDTLISQNMQALIQWWVTHMLQNKRPAPINGEDVLLLYPDSDDTVVTEVTPDLYAVYKELVQVRDRLSDYEQMKQALEVTLKDYMGEAERLVSGGKTLVSWKSQITRRFDAKAFQKQYPDMYTRYIAETKTRRFTVK